MPSPDDLNKSITELYPVVSPLHLLTPEEPLTLEQQVALHPETDKQRAVLILADCLSELSRCEAAGEDPPELMFFSTPPNGTIGRNGFMSLFPGMTNSPVGRFRGEGISCDLVETVSFIGVNFPDVMDQVLLAMYTEIEEPVPPEA